MRASEPLRHGAQGRIPARQNNRVPVVSIVVPFWGVPYRILIIYLVKTKKRNYNGDYRYNYGFESRV